VAGPVEPLVGMINAGNPQIKAKGVVLPNRDHMNAVGDRGYKDAVRVFFDGLT